MAERLEAHPRHPQPRSLRRAAELAHDGGLLVAPSDAGYLLAWTLDARGAEETAIRLRALDTRHPFTVLCRGLSEVGSLAKLDDRAFRLVKSLIPGPYTFILPASAELPRRLKQTRRRTVGVRVSENVVLRGLLDAVGAPLLSTTLSLADEAFPSHEAEVVAERMLRHVAVMLDAGDCTPGPTSVIDLTGPEPVVVRQGFQPLSLT